MKPTVVLWRSMMQLRFDSPPIATGILMATAAILWILLDSTTTFAEQVPESVVDIQVQGNETVESSWILQKIKTQPHRSLTGRMVLEDERALRKTRLFSHVDSHYEQSAKGAVLVFRVRERAIVRSVQYIGNDKVKQKQLVSWTGLEAGSPFDPWANEQAVTRIKQEYKEMGYFQVDVKLQKGGDPNDRDVIIEINEGPIFRVVGRKFKGNRQISSGSLKKNLVTKSAILGYFKGIYRPETLEQDVVALKEYCRRIGYFDAQIKAEPLFSKTGGAIRIVYTVDEGERYKIGRIKCEGNELFSGEELRKEARLNEGDFFNSNALAKDLNDMKVPYWDRGHYYANIVPEPQFSEQSGVVNLLLRFDEDRPRYIRDITPEIAGDSPYTKETVLLERLQVRPGDLADPRLINRGISRANGSQVFSGVRADVVRVDPETEMFTANGRTFRGQQPLPGSGSDASWLNQFTSTIDELPRLRNPENIPSGHSGLSVEVKSNLIQPAPHAPRRTNEPATNSGATHDKSDMSFRSSVIPSAPLISYRPVTPQFFQRPWGRLLTPEIALQEQPFVVRAQGPGGQYLPGTNRPERGNPILEGGPFYNERQALPPGYVDLNAVGTEGRTGRIMFGAGVNSDNGVVGSFVWEENNFDLFAPPQSFSDILNGRAFRGGGQRFRAEAAPGDIVSRYAVNWVDQYFMQTDYALSLSGFYYNRFFNDWSEDRVGGRVGIGEQLSPETSINATLRMEEVTINNPTVPTPTVLAREVGSNFLSTIRLSATNDTRNTAILPGEGHFMELGFEQAFGSYDYSRFDGEGRQYFTLFQRPDGSGRQVLTLATNLGFSTNDTPVFERYYAGGFQSFRGFAFRGVSPQSGGVSIGGTFQAMATVEYRVPFTADDMIQGVVFTDLGTVDNRVSFEQFRATVGVGLRVMIPAMGQVPLAFDFGFPIASETFDDERIFSFYVGILQ